MTILKSLAKVFLSLALGCLPAVCLAQATEDLGTATLSGQVVDSITGQPIARALVRGRGHETLTDYEGRFSLRSRANATLPEASKPGYLFDQPGVVSAGQAMVLRLSPEAILYGTAIDTNGQPIQHLEIQLRRLQVHSGLAHWQQLQTTATNAEGEFRFAELPAGKYSLTTNFLVDGLPEAPSSLAFVPTLYPPAGSQDAGDAITLSAGTHMEANLSLAAEKLYPVSGVIHGSLARGVNFSLATLEGFPVNVTPQLFADSGLFRFRVPRGSYRLNVQEWGPHPGDQQQFAGRREIAVGPAGLEGVSITLSPLPSIPVEVEYQHIAAGQQETAAPAFISLSLIGEDPANGFGGIPAEPVEPGSGLRVPKPGDPLIFRAVPPARYMVQGQIPPPWYLASATCGSLDLAREVLAVSDGSGACAMHVVLRDDSATLQWSVANQQQGRGFAVTVMAFPLANLAQDVGGANNSYSSNGDRVTGTVAGLSPGRYLVIAAQHTLDLPYRDPEALKKYAAWGKEVTLAANGEADIELELAPEEP